MNSIKRAVSCLVILAAICGSSLAGTGSAMSNIFTIDNRFSFPVYSLEDDSLLGYVVFLCGSDADPVNTATGNFYHDETDLTIATRSRPFEFSRHYNSKDTNTGPLGQGWTHSYNITMTSGLGASGDRVSVRWGDGRTEYWIDNGTGGYDPNMPGLYDSLEKVGDDWKLTKKNLDTYTFDSTGKLLTVTDKNANTFTLAYNGSNQLTTVTDPAGRTLVTLGYNPDGTLASVTDIAGRVVQYEYISGKLSGMVDTLGYPVDYDYNAEGRLETIVNQLGATAITNIYDTEGRVVQQTDARGNVTTFTYDTENDLKKTTILYPDGTSVDHLHSDNSLLLMIRYPHGSVQYAYDDEMNRTQIIDRNGNVTNFTYDTRGNVLTTMDPNDPSDPYDGGMTAIEYNDSNFPNLPTRKTDALANVTTWQYDAKGNAIRQINPDGNDVVWTYNGFGQKLTETDENNNAGTYTYDSNGLLTQATDGNGNLSWYGHDILWRLTQVIDGRGSGAGDASHTTTTVYDNADRAITVTGPITSQSYQYDPIGNRIKVTNGRGYESLYEYDYSSNLTKVTRVVPGDPNQVFEYTYDGMNRRITATNPNGNITQYDYDDMGRLEMQTDPLCNKSQWTYDSQGNVLSATDGAGVSTFYEYDTLNRKLKQYDELGDQWLWQYDKLGNLTKHVDANGNITLYSYDTLNRLVSVTDAANHTTIYEYDAVGNLTQIEDPNNKIVARKSYDAADRLIRREDGLGNAYLYNYDGAGNLVAVTDPDSRTKTMVYDNENRLTEVHYPDSSQVLYAYDNNGNLLAMTDSTGTTSYSYDALDRLIASTDSFGKTVQYGYDIAGNRTSLTYPADSTKPAQVVNYTYDAAGRLDRITDWGGRVWDYTMDEAGRIIDVNYPNDVNEVLTYDDAGRLESLVYKNSSDVDLISYAYTRDAQGNPTAINETGTLQPDFSVMFGKSEYAHDSDNRLISSTVPAAYAYDNTGNMTSSMTGGITTTFAYNYENHLVSQATGGNTVQHTYNGNGGRIARSENGTVARYILDEGRDLSHILCETDGSGEITAYYIHGPTIVGRIAADGTARYYHTDQIGNVVALSDDAEIVTDQYAYTPFGVPAGRTGSTQNPFTFIGGLGVMAEDDGLYFMRARFYEPCSGRFLSKDPVEGTLAQPVNLHRYNYALNNPLMSVDPDGNYSWSTAGSGVRQAGMGLINTASGVCGTATGIVLSEAGIGVPMAIKSFNTGVKGVTQVMSGIENITYRAVTDKEYLDKSHDVLREWVEYSGDERLMSAYEAADISLDIINLVSFLVEGPGVGLKTGGGGNPQFYSTSSGQYIPTSLGFLVSITKTTKSAENAVNLYNRLSSVNVPAFYDRRLNVYYVNGKAKKIN